MWNAAPAMTNTEALYRVLFLVFEWPSPRLKKPPWVHIAIDRDGVRSGGGVLLPHRRRNSLGCYCRTSSVGSVTDEHGQQRPAAFLA